MFAPLADTPPAAFVLPFVFSPVGALEAAAFTHGAPVVFGFVVCGLGDALLAGVGASCVGTGGAVVLSPAAFVVMGVGGPMVDADGAVEFIGWVVVVGATDGGGAAVVVLPAEAAGCVVGGWVVAGGGADRVVL